MRVILIDDGSTESAPDDLAGEPQSLAPVQILVLRRNLGHQRALAVGMCYIDEHFNCSRVLVMDGDGEDRPGDVVPLLEKYDEEAGKKIVFAERLRRSEGVIFTISYFLYRMIHLLLTGMRVRVGNFSVMPAAQLHRLVTVSDLWNHYSASVFRARLPYTTVPVARGQRYAGRTHMNFVSLVTHGLSAMSVFAEWVGVRILLTIIVLTSLLAVGAASFGAYRMFAGGAPPEWIAATLVPVCVLIAQLILLALVFVFVVLGGRGGSSFIPARDYAVFVDYLRTISREQSP